MNRYVAEGIARDVERGRRVAVLSDRPSESWHLLLAAFPTDDAIKVYRANGQEEIRHSGGGFVIVRRKAGPVLRGHVIDVIFVEPGGLTDSQMSELLPALSSQGELIRA